MKKKKFHSIMKRVVIWPLVIMLLLSAAVFTIAGMNYKQARERAVESRLDIIRSGCAQMENVMGQCESTFSRFFSTEINAGILKGLSGEEEYSDYFEYLVDSLRYLEPVWEGSDIVDGIVLYFPNISSLNFRSIFQKDLHNRLAELLKQDSAIYNHWFLLNTEKEQYIVFLMKSGDACSGCWMRVAHLLKVLGLEDAEELPGEIYVSDLFGENSINDPGLHEAVAGLEKGQPGFELQGKAYSNYEVRPATRSIYFGLLEREGNLFAQMPLLHQIVFSVAFLGLLLTIAIVFWLNTRISRPILMIVDAMQRFGNGETDYRLEERSGKTIDEFDLLGQSLNHMMDQVNDLEFSLYETKLKEQETQLRYISQQIRPHFILNALNVIYTYREDEFPLVKKMVMYLVNYFRYIVNLRVDFVELEREFRHVENYLKIQRERTQNQIDFYVEWEQAVSNALIPPLILQTFVENSIKYAVNVNHKLYIIVQGSEEADGRLKIRISDNGQGYPDEVLENIRRYLDIRKDDGCLGVGIVNAVERMDILYHGEIEMMVQNEPTGGACTEILLPLIREEAEQTTDRRGDRCAGPDRG